MAKNMLDAVYKAEENCKQREAEARLTATQAENQVKKDCARLINETEAKANATAQTLFEKAKQNGEAEIEKALKNAEIKCAEISETAEKNRTTVIKHAVNYLIG